MVRLNPHNTIGQSDRTKLCSRWSKTSSMLWQPSSRTPGSAAGKQDAPVFVPAPVSVFTASSPQTNTGQPVSPGHCFNLILIRWPCVVLTHLHLCVYAPNSSPINVNTIKRSKIRRDSVAEIERKVMFFWGDVGTFRRSYEFQIGNVSVLRLLIFHKNKFLITTAAQTVSVFFFRKFSLKQNIYKIVS